MIIDAHTHIGFDYVFEEYHTAEDLARSMELNKIDISIVQPGTTLDLDTARDQHNAIADLAKEMPNRIFGMATLYPRIPEAGYRDELERCVKKLGFVGIKLHPLAHAISPAHKASKKVFTNALELGIPVMIHTGDGIPWALPSSAIPIAKQFPDLKIILAHCGGGTFADEAALAASVCDNIYLETSWLPSTTILELCRNVGADRMMFGSDMALNAASELAKYRSIGLTEEEFQWCLYKTSAKVFKLVTT